MPLSDKISHQIDLALWQDSKIWSPNSTSKSQNLHKLSLGFWKIPMLSSLSTVLSLPRYDNQARKWNLGRAIDAQHCCRTTSIWSLVLLYKLQIDLTKKQPELSASQLIWSAVEWEGLGALERKSCSPSTSSCSQANKALQNSNNHSPLAPLLWEHQGQFHSYTCHSVQYGKVGHRIIIPDPVVSPERYIAAITHLNTRIGKKKTKKFWIS